MTTFNTFEDFLSASQMHSIQQVGVHTVNEKYGTNIIPLESYHRLKYDKTQAGLNGGILPEADTITEATYIFDPKLYLQPSGPVSNILDGIMTRFLNHSVPIYYTHLSSYCNWRDEDVETLKDVSTYDLAPLDGTVIPWMLSWNSHRRTLMWTPTVAQLENPPNPSMLRLPDSAKIIYSQRNFFKAVTSTYLYKKVFPYGTDKG